MRRGVQPNGILQQIANIFKHPRYKQVSRTLIFSTIIIFGIESLLMILFELILNIPEPIVWFIDAFSLVVLLFPLNYVFIVLPMMRQIEVQSNTNFELAKTNEILERLFSIDDVLIAYMDKDFNFIRVNQVYAHSDQHEPDFYVGKNHFDLFPNPENQAIFENVIRTGHTYRVTEKPFEYADNPERGISYWDWTLMPVKDPLNQVIGLMLVLNDVTNVRAARNELEESWRRFHAVFDQTYQQIFLLTPAGEVILANQTALDHINITNDQIQGNPFWQLPFWSQSVEESNGLKNMVALASRGNLVRSEKRLYLDQNKFDIMDASLKPLLNDEGKPIMLIFEARDISERIKTEELMRKSEEEIQRRYQSELTARRLAETLLNASQSLSGSLDSDTVFATLLDQICEVAPYTSAHLELLDDEEHLMVRMTRGEESWPQEKRLLGRRLEITKLPMLHDLLESRIVTSVADTTGYKGSPYFPGSNLIGAWMAIPLVAGDRVIGLCLLEHVKPNSFTPEMIQFADAMTKLAAINIHNAWLFEQVRDGREHLQALARRLVEVQESERHYIARELHDDAGQALASLMVGLRLLERDSQDSSAVITRSQELKQIADGILENLHRLAINLRPSSLDHLGLVAALRQHTEMVSDKHGVAVQFEVVGEIERLSSDLETAVYRIVQEAITNVIRHAQATRIDVLLKRRDESLVVIVEDNGIGFDPNTRQDDRLGVVGMYERATMLGGTLTIESTREEGTTVFLEVPWQSES